MEFIKTEKGWLNLETEHLILFGDLSANLYNILNEFHFAIRNILSIYYGFTVKESPFRIIGRDDYHTSYQHNIFLQDSNIAALMLFVASFDSSLPLNSLPYFDEEESLSTHKNCTYLPIYYKDVNQMSKLPSTSTLYNTLNENIANTGNSYEIKLIDDILTYETQNKMTHLIEYLSRKDSFTDLTSFQESRKRIIDAWLPMFNNPPISTIIREYNGQYPTVFLMNGPGQLYSRDLLELINLKYSLDYCPICNEMFVKRDGRINFCPKCSADKKLKKRYNDQKRKRNTIQIEHKAIVDMLRNRNENYNDFVNESYYYKDLIEGKEVQTCPDGYNSSIQTEKQYEEWLKKKHKELTKRPKKSPAH